MKQIEFNIEANRVIIARMDTLRVMLRMSVLDFAELIGCKNQAIHRWRTGINCISKTTCNKIENNLSLPQGTLTIEDVRFSIQDTIKIYFGNELVKVI